MQFIMVVDFSFVTLRLIPMVLATMKIPQLYVDKAVDDPIYAGADFLLWCRGQLQHVEVLSLVGQGPCAQAQGQG